jgi:hypothetical protein
MWPAYGWRKGELQAVDAVKGESTDAELAGGPPRSSEEAPVMGVERRRRVVLMSFGGQPGFSGGAR